RAGDQALGHAGPGGCGGRERHGKAHRSGERARPPDRSPSPGHASFYTDGEVDSPPTRKVDFPALDRAKGSPMSTPTAGPAPPERASWDEYFMNIAREVATRSTCDRKHVGAVLVRDKSILATGYNGSIRGLPHCDEVGCLMEDGHCVRTVHAEAN